MRLKGRFVNVKGVKPMFTKEKLLESMSYENFSLYCNNVNAISRIYVYRDFTIYPIILDSAIGLL